MANNREELVDRFFVVSGAGKVQAAKGTGLANSDLDTRDKCTITRELIVDRRETRDCRNEYMLKTKIRTRYSRITLNYAECTPQIIHRWTSILLGAAAGPSGTPANEVQTLTRSGTVSGGTFTLSMTLEGRTVTTKPIAWNATNQQIQDALTAARMLFIQPGDVAVTGGWGTAITITFPNTGRLGRANLPMLVADTAALTGSTPGITVAQSTAGDQNHHTASRSTSRDKLLTSFALGWDDVTDRVEKYIDYAVESVTPSYNQDGDVALQVTLTGPAEYDSIETAFEIPDCTNIDPLQSYDCRVEVNGIWETTDIVSLSAGLNDNIPFDRASAFQFEGIDVQTQKRGPQPTHTLTLSIIGSEEDPPYDLAFNERTSAPVPVILHFGLPGNRATWNFPATMIRFQTNPQGNVGTAQLATIQLEGLPVKDGLNKPMNAEAYLDQGTSFLVAA